MDQTQNMTQQQQQDLLFQGAMMNQNAMKYQQPIQVTSIVSSFKDLMKLKKHSPPNIDVLESKVQNDTIGKHHLYRVKGNDHNGEFDVYRRYKQFDLLRNVLHSRFMGLYVPPIPEKKALGNTDDIFV